MSESKVSISSNNHSVALRSTMKDGTSGKDHVASNLQHINSDISVISFLDNVISALSVGEASITFTVGSFQSKLNIIVKELGVTPYYLTTNGTEEFDTGLVFNEDDVYVSYQDTVNKNKIAFYLNGYRSAITQEVNYYLDMLFFSPYEHEVHSSIMFNQGTIGYTTKTGMIESIPMSDYKRVGILMALIPNIHIPGCFIDGVNYNSILLLDLLEMFNRQVDEFITVYTGYFIVDIEKLYAFMVENNVVIRLYDNSEYTPGPIPPIIEFNLYYKYTTDPDSMDKLGTTGNKNYIRIRHSIL